MTIERPIPSGGPRPASVPGRERRDDASWPGAATTIAAERRIADRFARLHAATAALSAALTPSDVAAAIAGRGVALAGAVACAVGLPSQDGITLELAAARGAIDQASGWSLYCPASADLPVATAFRERRPIFVTAVVAPPPGCDPAGAVGCGFCAIVHPALAAFPLATGDRVLGAIALSFAEAHEFDEEERAFLGAFAHQAAQALDRARLYEAERAARLEAERAVEAARRAIELQERLVGIVGHDLRTPLAAIRMATGLLFRRGGLTEEQARTLARLGGSAERMTRIIRDLLDFTRVRKDGTLPVHPAAVDLAELARRAVSEHHEVHPERSIALDLPASAPAFADAERVVQVVSNLVGNALQHSPPAARVEVRLRTGRDGGHVLEVWNEGPAIDPELLPSLFEPFRQGPNRDDRSGSIGLGLFIVRELVRAHGGDVEVRSDREAGTTFTIRLPGLRRLPASSGRDAPDR